METKENNMNLPVFVGQVLYREIYNRSKPIEIIEYTVSRVGRKYFYLNGLNERYPVSKDTLRYVDKQYLQSSFQLYMDKQEILDRIERSNLYDKLKDHFSWSGNSKNNTLQQLREAVKILEII